ncbi:MAG TPA: nitroreductase family protein [Ktedonobacterales bacterium]|nr:nitroreductase family protein [Ktedonobacterales bacterium]
MNLTDVVRRRRMVRHFSPDPVSPDAIDRILDLARHAPSAGFTQGQSFIVVTRPDLREAIGRICGEQEYVAGGFHPFISSAPVLVIPCTSEAAYHRRYQEPDKLDESGNETEWPVPYWHMDIGCSVMLVLLAAVDEGLAAGFAGAPTSALMQEMRDLLGIPAEVTPVGVIPIGHRAPDVPSPSLKRGRKPEADYAHREQW